MRPLRLDLAGFAVFRDETTIDFTDADFFVLVGPTGSGKSTVLDAICFALYGTVPRWGSARGLAHALAPSATEARVRLVFESAGARYVATRVVRRDGRGNVKTASAGLQLMPPGFDVSRLDTGLTPEDLGEVLAGTPAEMEQAVLTAVGLPYEQFTSCVLLPQGQFADFLHAKPAVRQQILVNLLGLGIYEEIQKKAAERATRAEAQLTAVDRVLGELDDVTEEAVEAAAARVVELRELAAAVEAAVPELEVAQREAESAAAALVALDNEIARLSAVRPPADVNEIAGLAAAARAAVAEAAATVSAVEEAEEKVRSELAAAADPAALHLLLDAHAERDRLATEAETLAAKVTTAEAAVAAARAAAAKASAAVAEAEKTEEKVRSELAAAADPAALHLLLDAHAERDRLATEAETLAAKVTTAEAEHAAATAALGNAVAAATRADEELEAARQACQEAQTADRAGALRAHLAVGHACPVCTQPVTVLPPPPAGSNLAAAEAAAHAARIAANAAQQRVAEHDRALRDLDRNLERARAQHEQITTRLAELNDRLTDSPSPTALRRDLNRIAELQRRLDEATTAVRTARQAQRIAEHDRALRDLNRNLERARAQHEQITTRLAELNDRLTDSPSPTALRRDLNRIAELQRRLDEATTAVRTARQAHRAAQAAAASAEERVRNAWRDFDAVRDNLATLDPPAVDRDDLAEAWRRLGDWAAAEADRRRSGRSASLAAVADAEAATAAVRGQLNNLFTAADAPPPDNERPAMATAPSAYLRAVAVAVERAEAEQRRLAERREQATRLREQRAEHERDARVARALAGHLRANNFERWLLTEALDLLVDGASRILRELSGGQYDLGHDKGEFFVIDHHDAGLRRGVRTLSGGETFQASLALALALSEQLAGMSTASASLESIVLDEGFGTLDAATLDMVAATLESLAARGDRMVGVVTHVPALAERVPVRFEVRKDARTARVERVG